MSADQYFLPTDYQPNPVNVTLDEVSGDEYWNDERVVSSSRYQRAAYELAARRAAEFGLHRIVDVGCGVATKLTECFDPNQFELVGIDQAPAVAACRRLRRPGSYYAENFENPDNAVRDAVAPADMVISSDVIEHLLDPTGLLKYILGMLAPSGLAVITTPERIALHGSDATAPTNPAHIREWAAGEFVRYLEANGFTVRETHRLAPFSYKFDRLTASWFLNRARRGRSLRTNLVVVAEPATGAT